MSKIKEGDWVVSDVGLVSTYGNFGKLRDVFVQDMVITVPTQVVRHSSYSEWFTIGWYSYHPDWLRKVNQDGTPIEWSWLTELGW